MSKQNAPTTTDDLQRLDNLLRDTPTDGLTRRVLLRRAAVGAAVASASASAAIPGQALAMGSDGSVRQIIDTAVTAEALAVTYLTRLVHNASKTGVGKFVDVLKAANAAEYDHYRALTSLGAKPLTTKFWAPDAFFKPGEPFKVLETAETLFVDAYLIGATAFAAANVKLARYAGEIGAVEAQHLALVRFAQNKLPDDRSFQAYPITHIGGIVTALEKAGIGFGRPGAKPGRFYTFSPPPASAVVAIANNGPQ